MTARLRFPPYLIKSKVVLTGSRARPAARAEEPSETCRDRCCNLWNVMCDIVVLIIGLLSGRKSQLDYRLVVRFEFKDSP